MEAFTLEDNTAGLPFREEGVSMDGCGGEVHGAGVKGDGVGGGGTQ